MKLVTIIILIKSLDLLVKNLKSLNTNQLQILFTAMLFPEETTLEFYNQFYHMHGSKSADAETGSQQSASAETGASLVALLKRQNYWIATKFGYGKEECVSG